MAAAEPQAVRAPSRAPRRSERRRPALAHTRERAPRTHSAARARFAELNSASPHAHARGRPRARPRHTCSFAELNKLEEKLKLASQSEALLKRKCDALELSLQSVSASASRETQHKVRAQLREREEQLAKQHEIKDVHTASVRRPTYNQVLGRQIAAIDEKIASVASRSPARE